MSSDPKTIQPLGFVVVRDACGKGARGAHTIIDALRDAGLAIMERSTGWHPAAIAPKGEKILTWDGKRMAVVRWCGCAEQWERPDDTSEWEFTHWMPLPEPPKEKARAKTAQRIRAPSSAAAPSATPPPRASRCACTGPIGRGSAPGASWVISPGQPWSTGGAQTRSSRRWRGSRRSRPRHGRCIAGCRLRWTRRRGRGLRGLGR